MTARRSSDTAALAAAVVRARDVEGVAWKVLMRRTGLSRTWLFELYRRGRREAEMRAAIEAGVREKMFTKHRARGQRGVISFLTG